MGFIQNSRVIGFRPRLLFFRTIRLSSTKSCEPLKILFCGSDEISIASLKALHAEHKASPTTIASIDVACRPGKRVGRGRKTIREVPIKAAAKDLFLTVHEIDTFTGWTPPHKDPYNLIVAVSFGLLVPRRILGLAKYGGLNVHPSLLPDFRGPAPIYHTLLAGDTKTGVTLQTLHESKFDHGTILDQTSFDIPQPETCSVQELSSISAKRAAELLISGIKKRLFVPPLLPLHPPSPEANARNAAKIHPSDRHIDWSWWTWDRIFRYHRILGSLWNHAAVPDSNGSYSHKRIIFMDLDTVEPDIMPEFILPVEPGIPFALHDSFTEDQDRPIYVLSSDERIIRVNKIKVEGYPSKGAYQAAIKAKIMDPLIEKEVHDNTISRFHSQLQ
ncbi:Methionyl-tRNA formyltransferase [Ophidiomyces ophidiicola]|nr:Methionyl-tRNA formyltransferase [Ophidiomyces ophidiicola]